MFDQAGVKAKVALNSQVCEVFPKAVQEMKKRVWNSWGTARPTRDARRARSGEGARHHPWHLEDDRAGTGKRPRGWLGAGLVETYNTLDILAEEGVNYCGDWNNDDEPYPMKVKSGKMFAIPYCAEINDIPLYMRKGYTGEQYVRSVLDHSMRSIPTAANSRE